MAFNYLLLAAQAAGIGANIFGKMQQNRIEGYGYAMDQAALQTRMQQEGLVAQQETLADLGRLRETMATQRAILGARGQGVQGSAGSLMEQSVKAQKSEEKIKNLNSSFRVDYLQGLGRLKRIEQQARRGERGMQLLGQSLNMTDFNSLFGGMLSNKKPTATKVGK